MIEEAIIILVAVIVGYSLRGFKIDKIKEKVQQIKKKALPNKSEVLEWEAPKTEEELAEEEVRKNL